MLQSAPPCSSGAAHGGGSSSQALAGLRVGIAPFLAQCRAVHPPQAHPPTARAPVTALRVRPMHTGQGRTGQDRTGQDRTGQDRTGQDRAGQDRTGQDRTGQDRTGQDRTGQDPPIAPSITGMVQHAPQHTTEARPSAALRGANTRILAWAPPAKAAWRARTSSLPPLPCDSAHKAWAQEARARHHPHTALMQALR